MDAREESFFKGPSMQKLLKVAGYNHDRKDGTLEPSPRFVSMHLTAGRAQIEFFSTLQLGARIHGTSISNNKRASCPQNPR